MNGRPTFDVYEKALRGEAVWTRSADGDVGRLPARRWTSRSVDSFEYSVLGLCSGPTLDLGCGPGRFVAWLAERGTPALGVDVSGAAVDLARNRGGIALCRDLFGQLPGSGRWHHVLLMDGNIGIGADPARLLNRVCELLRPSGTAIVEFDSPGVAIGVRAIRLETRTVRTPWFPWAHAGLDTAPDLAADAGLRLVCKHSESGRHLAVLQRCGMTPARERAL